MVELSEFQASDCREYISMEQKHRTSVFCWLLDLRQRSIGILGGHSYLPVRGGILGFVKDRLTLNPKL